MNKLLLIFPFLLLLSCSVQKRKYQNGYYVDWHRKNTVNKTDVTKHEAGKHEKNAGDETTIQRTEEKTALASADNKKLSLEVKKTITLLKSLPDTCDVLVFKDGSEIKAQVKEIGTTEIKYRRCDTPDGPTYISRKSEIFMIKYANGTREVIKSEDVPEVKRTQPKSPNVSENTYKPRIQKRQAHPLAVISLVTGVLSAVIGYLMLVALLFGLLFPISFFIIPFIAAIIAVASGITALKRIREEPDLYKGKGLAVPGIIVGGIVLAICLFIGFLFLLFSM
jgi:hypothetical protein